MEISQCGVLALTAPVVSASVDVEGPGDDDGEGPAWHFEEQAAEKQRPNNIPFPLESFSFGCSETHIFIKQARTLL